MRIAYCISTLAIGGAEKQTLLLADQMRRRGHIVLLLVLFTAQDAELETQLPVVRLNQPRSVRGLLRAVRLVQPFLTAFQADIFHSHTFPANLFARLLVLRGLALPVVHTFHNVTDGGPLRTLVYRLTRRSMTASTAVSQAVRTAMLRRRIATPQTIAVIPNGIDLAAFSADAQQRKLLREEFSADAFVWIAIGRITRAKDYPNLLRAFALLRAEQPSSTLWIVGALGEDRHRSRNRDLLDLMQSAPGVRWLGPRTDIPALLFAADGFVLSSAWEGAPLVLIEAMAMQLPIVATDVGGIREIIADCGQLVPPQDSTALAAAMLRSMQDRDGLRPRLQAARTRAEQHFNLETIADQWQSFYGNLVQPEGGNL